MQTQVAIYGLFDPRDGDEVRRVRYIGRKLIGPAGLSAALNDRLQLHVSHNDGQSRRARWVRHLRELGLRPVIKAICLVGLPSAAWQEKHAIAVGLSRGWPLTNAMVDSRHRPVGFTHSEETKKRISESRRGKGLGGHDAAWRAAVSKAHTGRKLSAETRAKISAAAKRRALR